MGHKRSLTDAQLDEACEMRERGYSPERISQAFAARGVAVKASSVRWLCLVNGADLPPEKRRPHMAPRPGLSMVRRGHIVRTFTPAEDRRLRALEAERLRISEIARRLGRATSSVRNRLAILAKNDARREDATRAAPRRKSSPHFGKENSLEHA